MNIDIMSMMIGQKVGGGAGGKGLPAVTSADNGKHLEVVNGKWKVKNPNSTIVALWEETQQAFTPNPQFGNLPCAAFLPSAAINTGETYYVLWEGKEYACVGVDMNLGALTGVALGNGGLLGLSGDTGEPFLIGYNPSDGTCAIVTATEGSHRFGLYAEVAGESGGGGVTIELLWTNPSPYAVFKYQTISFESSYKAFYMEYRNSTNTSDNQVRSAFLIPSDKEVLVSTFIGNMESNDPVETYMEMYSRPFTVSENSIYVGQTSSFKFGCVSEMKFFKNDAVIPYRIWGIK